jgi:predicted  nucleic acid-binding Zn-ribbon protein
MAEVAPAGNDAPAGNHTCTNWGCKLDVDSASQLSPCPSCGCAATERYPVAGEAGPVGRDRSDRCDCDLPPRGLPQLGARRRSRRYAELNADETIAALPWLAASRPRLVRLYEDRYRRARSRGSGLVGGTEPPAQLTLRPTSCD